MICSGIAIATIPTVDRPCGRTLSVRGTNHDFKYVRRRCCGFGCCSCIDCGSPPAPSGPPSGSAGAVGEHRVAPVGLPQSNASCQPGARSRCPPPFRAAWPRRRRCRHPPQWPRAPARRMVRLVHAYAPRWRARDERRLELAPLWQPWLAAGGCHCGLAPPCRRNRRASFQWPMDRIVGQRQSSCPPTPALNRRCGRPYLITIRKSSDFGGSVSARGVGGAAKRKQK